MDTSDPDIFFDEQGVCNHCHLYGELEAKYCHQGAVGKRLLAETVDRIRADGRGRSYDCLIGVSGGVDSTYVAYLVKQAGLRPLAVHVDNGWNSELAVKNIENVLTHLGIDLYTQVLDWDTFRDLQLAFLRASVPDAEIPTDHAIGGVLYRMAAKHGLRHIISGSNIVTEGMLPARWVYGVADWSYIRAIHAQFGTRPLRNFPHYSLTDLAWYTGVRRIRSFRILDYVPYVKADAMHTLQTELGWKNYGGKHHESIYTRFFQGYILPRKFNIDKRRSHLSTLICAGQLSREEASAELTTSPYPEALQAEDREYVLKKFSLSSQEFDAIMTAPVKSYRDYPNHQVRRDQVKHLLDKVRLLGLVRRFVQSW